MLSPALKRLFDELDKVDPHERTAFENDLHRELSRFDKMLAAAQPFMSAAKRGKVAEPPSRAYLERNVELFSSIATLAADLESSPSIMSDADLGIGPYLTAITTKCAKQDCPNKRKK